MPSLCCSRSTRQHDGVTESHVSLSYRSSRTLCIWEPGQWWGTRSGPPDRGSRGRGFRSSPDPKPRGVGRGGTWGGGGRFVRFLGGISESPVSFCASEIRTSPGGVQSPFCHSPQTGGRGLFPSPQRPKKVPGAARAQVGRSSSFTVSVGLGCPAEGGGGLTPRVTLRRVVLLLYGALDSHPFFPSHVASGRCVLAAAAAAAPFVVSLPRQRGPVAGAPGVVVVVVRGRCAVCAAPIPLRVQVVPHMPRRVPVRVRPNPPPPPPPHTHVVLVLRRLPPHAATRVSLPPPPLGRLRVTSSPSGAGTHTRAGAGPGPSGAVPWQTPSPDS